MGNIFKIIIVLLVLVLSSCENKYKSVLKASIKRHKEVVSLKMGVTDNEILIDMKVLKKDTFNVSCFVFLNDSSIEIREINGKIIKTVSCMKEQPDFPGSSYGLFISSTFGFGEGKEMQGKVEVKNIDELINKIDIIDSVLKSMPEYPDTNCFFHYSYKDLNEVYYFRYDEKMRETIDSLIDNCRLPIKFRRLDCNCH